MTSFNSLKAWMRSVAIVTGLTGSAMASHGHSGAAHHGGSVSHHHHHSGGGSSFRFGIGGLGYGYGYPSYGYGFSYGSYPYRYGGYRGYGYGGSGIGLQIYSTPSYYYQTPNYTTPIYSAPAYSVPNRVIVNPVPSVPAPTFDNGPIVIRAPASNDRPVDYQLNGQSFTIKPGQSQRFNHDRDWIVEFNRGEGKGAGKYSLKATTYKFKMTENGWELFEAAKPEPPADADQGEAPKPIDLVNPAEEVVKPKAVPAAPAPAPDKTDGDAK